MSKNNETIISKTSFVCGGGECPYATYNRIMHREASSSDMEYVRDNGKDVGLLARELFPNAAVVEYSDCYKQADETKRLIAEGADTICEASFLADDLFFCAVDILKITNPGHVELIEVKSATKIKDIFYLDVAYQIFVLERCGYTVDAAYVMYVNSEYVRGKSIDPEQYFITTDVTTDAFNLQDTVKGKLSVVLDALRETHIILPHITECCLRPYKCPYWDTVCKPMRPENSVFDIVGGMRVSTKIKRFSEGTRSMADFLKLKGQNQKYVQQCRTEVEEDDSIQVFPVDLENFLGKISFPITSLDFETVNEAIPLFEGQKPYAQTVTQFSMHILHEYGGNLQHFEYLADPNTDWRVAVAHALVNCCPSEGTVLVWNDAMEKKRIIEFAELEGNEDIKDDLLRIAGRIEDLMVPFRDRVIYKRAMHGSYSVKKVLPALCPDDKNLSYDDLSINNGMIASMVFSRLVHDKDLTDFQSATMKRALLTYCELDTYAPFAILDVMYKLIDPTAIDLFVKTKRCDNTHKEIRVGDRVSTNIGIGEITGFTRYFARVRLNAGYSVLRMPKNLYNLSGLEVPEIKDSQICSWWNESQKHWCTNRLHEFVVTDNQLGEVIGSTAEFLKIKLADGSVVLRKNVVAIR